ncbi:MAG TPA: hypothetical protein VF772_13875 [Terriglobales bacterium]
MYFGKLSGYGTSNPVLTDVYYILSKQPPTTKQVQNVVVKHGKELHGPDRIYLNAKASLLWNRSAPTPRSRSSFGSEPAEVASTASFVRLGKRRRGRWLFALAELLCLETMGTTFDVVH